MAKRPKVVLTSSTSAVFGPPGQAVYAAANAYTDFAAAYYSSKGYPVTAIHWGGWTIGMSEDYNIATLPGELFFTPEEGTKLLTPDVISCEHPTTTLVKITSWADYAKALPISPTILTNIFTSAVSESRDPILGEQSQTSDPGVLSWSTIWPNTSDPLQWEEIGLGYLTGHKIGGVMVIPGTMWVVMMTRAVELAKAAPVESITLNNIRLRAALEITGGKGRGGEGKEVATVVDSGGDGWRVRVCARDAGGEWKVHAEATAGMRSRPVVGSTLNDPAIVNPASLYKQMESAGFNYSGPFRAVSGLRKSGSRVDSVVRNHRAGVVGGWPSPATLDAVTQISSLIGGNGLPYRMTEVTMWKLKEANLSEIHAAAGGSGDAVDIIAATPDEAPIIEVTQLEVISASAVKPGIRTLSWAALEPNPAATITQPIHIYATENFSDTSLPDAVVHTNVSSIPESTVLHSVLALSHTPDGIPWDHLTPFIGVGTRLWTTSTQPPSWIRSTIIVSNESGSVSPLGPYIMSSAYHKLMRVTSKGVCEVVTRGGEVPTGDGEGVGWKLVVKPGFEVEKVRVAPPACGADEVVIAVDIWSLNFLDVLLASGVMSSSRLGDVGGECLGRVTHSTTPSLPIGTLIAGLPVKGGLSSYAVIPVHRCHAVPEGFDKEHAASVSLAFGTAWLAVKWLADVKPTDSVLIHAAAGGVGQACLKLLSQIGATVYCTVSSEAKRRYLVEECGVPERNIFNSRKFEDFTKGVLRETNGEGVDVVVNSLAEASMKASLALLKPFGRFVELGKRDQENHTLADLNLFSMGQRYMSAHLDVLLQNPRLSTKLLDEIWTHLEANPVTPIPTKAFPIDQSSDALSFLNSGQHIGKVVIKTTVVPPSPNPPQITAPDELRDVCADLAQTTSANHVIWTSNIANFQPPRGSTVILLQGDAVRESGSLNAIFGCRLPDVKYVLIDEGVELKDGVALGRAIGTGGKWFEVTLEDGRTDSEEGTTNELSFDEVVGVLVKHVSRRLRLAANEVDVTASLGSMGLDSLAQLQLAHGVRTELGVAGVEIYDGSTIVSVAKSVSTESSAVTVVTPKQKPRGKILCLHGFRSSREVLLSQLGGLVERGWELLLVDAPNAARGPGDPSIPQEVTTHEWWSCPSRADKNGVSPFETAWDGPDKTGLPASLTHLENIVATHGPFTGILGFSQGASLIPQLLSTTTQRPPSFCVYLSTILPVAPVATIIPTLHVFDPQEPLASMCEEAYSASGELAEKVTHCHGHSIPHHDEEAMRAVWAWMERR
eukprot:TRINITY_DN10607_c0_g1_i1.p1 TRINITY_DN10607_c0_g1~~TRINITY_DN10607_c0_g1_i1.p1  ORF type:complete len:1465 (+),score=131.45 TRINITY_DN10607_c0_g1_i1:544-4395(+)